MKLLKKLAIAIIVIIFMVMASCEPKEPEGDLTPYMSDLTYIPATVSAKSKVKKKMFRKSEYNSLGEYTLTAYCGCAYCCGRAGAKTASGTTPKPNHTIAADTRLLPYGTTVFIKGEKYVVEDCGSAVKGKHIDIFFDSHSEALKFGTKKAEVYKRKSPQVLYKMKLVKIDNLKKITRIHVSRFARAICRRDK